MDKKQKKTLLAVVLVGLFGLVIVGVAIVGTGVYFVASHVQTETIAGAAGGERLARVRERFAGRQPLLEIRDRDQPILHRPEAAAATADVLQSLRVLVHDPNDGRLVNVEIPFWLLRIMPTGRFSFLHNTGVDLDPDRMHLTASDLESFGPGIVLDYRDPRGAEVLIWTE